MCITTVRIQIAVRLQWFWSLQWRTVYSLRSLQTITYWEVPGLYQVGLYSSTNRPTSTSTKYKCQLRTAPSLTCISEMPRTLVSSWTSVEPAELVRLRARRSLTTPARRCTGSDNELCCSRSVSFPARTDVIMTRNVHLWHSDGFADTAEVSAIPWRFRFTF